MRRSPAQSQAEVKCDLNVNVTLGTGIFAASKIVTIAPTHVLVNDSDVDLQICQKDTNVIQLLKSKEQRPLYLSLNTGTLSSTCMHSKPLIVTAYF